MPTNTLYVRFIMTMKSLTYV